MKNLNTVIPMAGSGTRFKKEGFTRIGLRDKNIWEIENLPGNDKLLTEWRNFSFSKQLNTQIKKT